MNKNKQNITTDNQNELFIVVDKDDNILGYKTRRECHSDRSLIHRAIHILITNDKGEILLQKRSKTKDLQPGLYTLSVGGHVTKGETYETTAKRELFEELGINTPIELITKYLAEVADQTEYVKVYEGQFNGPFKIDPKEIEEVAFFPKNKLSEMKGNITPISLLTLKHLNLL